MIYKKREIYTLIIPTLKGKKILNAYEIQITNDHIKIIEPEEYENLKNKNLKRWLKNLLKREAKVINDD